MGKAILFDLDGTLTDSGEGIMNCAKLALTAYGIPIPEEKVLRTIVGPPLDDSLIRLGIPADQVDTAVAIFRKRYSSVGKYENFPYPGIQDLLKTLQSQGHLLYVATSKPEVMALDIMDHFGLAPYFEKICGASLDRSRSSKEAVISYLLETCPKAESIVMVGDTAYDVLGARAHGIPCIGVAWGYGKREDMEKAGAAAIADDMQQLLTLLNTDLSLM